MSAKAQKINGNVAVTNANEENIMSQNTAIGFVMLIYGYISAFFKNVWHALLDAANNTFNVTTGVISFALGIAMALFVGFTGLTLFVGTCAYAGIAITIAFGVNLIVGVAKRIWNKFFPDQTVLGVATGVGEEVSLFAAKHQQVHGNA